MGHQMALSLVWNEQKMFCEGPLLSQLPFQFHSFILMTKNNLLSLLYVHIWACTQRKQSRQRAPQLVQCSWLWLTPSAQHHALLGLILTGTLDRKTLCQPVSQLPSQAVSKSANWPVLALVQFFVTQSRHRRRTGREMRPNVVEIHQRKAYFIGWNWNT